MEEQLISFETAKLAKEKGFNHIKANVFGDTMAYDLVDGALILAHHGNVVSGYILAPTQSLLQKWLREKAEIIVEVNFQEGKYYNRVYWLHKEEDYVVSPDFDTWEACLEQGVQTALALLP